MSSESTDRSKQAAAANDPLGHSLPFSEAAKRTDVPVFQCLVYLTRDESGRVRARVANLPAIDCERASEREALAFIVPLFKQRIRDYLTSETPIPWIEPPESLKPGEQKRFIPVHL